MAEIPKTPRDAGAELEARFRKGCPRERLCILGAGHEGECGFNLTHVPGIGIPAPDALAEAATRVPNYYRLPGLFRMDDNTPADVLDLVEHRWPDCDNFCEKDVLKYLIRAGLKPGVPAARDWLKIVRVAARKYRRLSGENLPADV